MIPRAATACNPPPGLDGWDPSWSRWVSAPDADGVVRTWHVLDNGITDAPATLLCVHGNPTWSYAWRELARRSTDWRVVAVDALNMGWSERIGAPRRLAEHIADLGAVTDAMGLTGPVVTVAHDWGGPISLGWALDHLDQLSGVVLMNTGVARPEGTRIPPIIQLFRSRATEQLGCVTTPAFVRGTMRLARPPLTPAVRRSFLSPYSTRARRSGIADFVADIPVDDDHPTHATLDGIARRLGELAAVPALLMWGARDPVFSDVFLADLRRRLPHAAVHRHRDAGHLVMEDVDGAGPILDWVRTAITAPHDDPPRPSTVQRRPLWSALADRAGDDAVAVVEMDQDGSGRTSASITFAELDARVRRTSARLGALGVAPGARVAPLLEPGIDLVAVVYACWRAGAVVVAADAALGLRGVRRSLRSASPDVVIGDARGLAAARGLRIRARAFSLDPLPAVLRRSLRVEAAVDDPLDFDDGSRSKHDVAVGPDDPAVVVFTSGSTGPSKGVVYRHDQLEAQRDALVSAYSLTTEDRLVAAFAPFAILGPALGIASVVPDMKVTEPGSLAATAFAAAARAIGASITFASPAALANVVATADGLDPADRTSLAALRVVVSAGAPISAAALRDVPPVFPNADIHTPYGMTELMPVTNVTYDEIVAAGPGNGSCVGTPLDGVEVVIAAVDASGVSSWELIDAAGVTGEICVRAEHAADGYDGLWAVDHATRRHGWHRTGDVGHLDEAGRLWVEGRVAHLVLGVDGPITPVGVEQRAETVASVTRAAAVGVGPPGTQQLVVVVTLDHPSDGVVANASLSAAVRAAASREVAAVLVVAGLPTDRRHNSKIDRLRVGKWASDVLAGRRVRRL